jgi:hypothetical protein
VALVRTNVSEEGIASIFRVKEINELGTTLAVTSNRSSLQINTTSVASYYQRCSYLAGSFHSDDGGDTFLQPVGSYKIHMASHHRRRHTSNCQRIVHFCRTTTMSSSQSFWLLTQRSRVRFAALPDFLSGSGSGTGSTQPL